MNLVALANGPAGKFHAFGAMALKVETERPASRENLELPLQLRSQCGVFRLRLCNQISEPRQTTLLPQKFTDSRPRALWPDRLVQEAGATSNQGQNFSNFYVAQEAAFLTTRGRCNFTPPVGHPFNAEILTASRPHRGPLPRRFGGRHSRDYLNREWGVSTLSSGDREGNDFASSAQRAVNP